MAPERLALLPYVHPPAVALLLAPLGSMPLEAAYGVMVVLTVASLCVAVVLLRPRPMRLSVSNALHPHPAFLAAVPSCVAIIGAGVTGLVAGRELARRGYRVSVFERWPDVGGMASAFDLGGVWLERYYHHLFRSDREMTALHEELLPGAIEWHRSTVGMYARGRLWPFVTPRDLLGYGPLALPDRLRFGVAALALARRRDWQRMDDMAALPWLRRACGDRVLDAVWRPLLLGKFGGEAADIPLAWVWSKLVLRRKLGGRGVGREELGYPRGSFRAICVALADEIRRNGGEIHLDREVVHVRRSGDGYLLFCAGAGAYRRGLGSSSSEPSLEAQADAVLLTTPNFIARTLAEWPASYLADLDRWSYRSALVLLLELRRPFSSTYWTNVVDADVPFLGLVEHTNLVPAERYPARYLYVANYVATDDPVRRLRTEELLLQYLPALRRMDPSFRLEDVMRRWSFSDDGAQPVPRVGNRHRLLPLDTPLPGLFLANTTQIYPEDRGTNYSVALGRRAAAQVAGCLPL